VRGGEREREGGKKERKKERKEEQIGIWGWLGCRVLATLGKQAWLRSTDLHACSKERIAHKLALEDDTYITKTEFFNSKLQF
jgi:hypothetical protein